MSYWIADALVQARESAGLEPKQMATILDVHEHTIKRLEEGQSMGRDIDKMVAAYADMAGIDGRELWWGALYLWYANGSAPRFTAQGPAAAYARVIREAARRLRQDGGAKPGRPTAIPAPPWLDHRKQQQGS